MINRGKNNYGFFLRLNWCVHIMFIIGVSNIFSQNIISGTVKDARLNGGISGIRVDLYRSDGPTRQLRGDRNLPMMDVNIRISVGDDGAFNGVYSQDSNGNEVVMSPAAWNAQHEQKAPK